MGKLSINKMSCKTCQGEGWVCENHPKVKWNDGDPECCGGAGMPCKCNKSDPPWNHNTELMKVTGVREFKGDVLIYTENGIYKIKEKRGKR